MKETSQHDSQALIFAEHPQKINHAQMAQEQQDHFFTSPNGLKKRKIYLNVKYSREEHKWIKQVQEALKKQKNINITKTETLLRYYYSSNLEMAPCIQKLAHYYQWFSSDVIQTVSKKAKKLLENGFVYSYDVTKQGRAFIIMNIGDMDFEKFELTNFYQAINHVNNRVIHQKFIPGKIQTYDYVLDLNEKFLSLPISSIKEIIKTFSDVYSMRLQNMYIVNCTHLAKWIYYGIQKFINEQTSKKIKLFTKEDVQAGVLRQFIDENMLQKKLGGLHPDIQHNQQQSKEQSLMQNLNETQYFSIQEQNSMFMAKNDEIPCCGTAQCAIY